MEFKTIKTEDDNNYYLCKTNKFKTITISYIFIDKIQKNEVTALALLSLILNYCNEKYKSTQELNAKLETFYNSSMRISSQISGDLSLFSFTFTGINPKFCNDKNYTLLEIIKFFYSFFTPFLNSLEDEFNEKVFTICKENYSNELVQLEEDKELFTYLKLLDLLNHEYSIRGMGYLDEVKNITNKQCYQLFLKILKRPLFPFIIGDLNATPISKLISKRNINFKFNKIYADLPIVSHQSHVEFYDEKKDFSQSMLGISFTSKIVKNDALYYPMLLLNIILGDSSFSKLFLTVRERYGYCYNIYSSYDNRMGTIFVLAGIDAKYQHKTYDLIIEQLEHICRSRITTKELKFAKLRLTSEINSYVDSPSIIISKELDNILLPNSLSLKDAIGEIKKITVEDVAEAARRIHIKDCFFLEQQEEK